VKGDTVKPAAQGCPVPDGGGFSGEHQESALESVLGILAVVQHVAANPQDHRPVPPDESGEGHLIVMTQEILEELLARQPFHGLGGRQPPDVPNHALQLRSGHVWFSPHGFRLVV
jgi:hypothetical protein